MNLICKSEIYESAVHHFNRLHGSTFARWAVNLTLVTAIGVGAYDAGRIQGYEERFRHENQRESPAIEIYHMDGKKVPVNEEHKNPRRGSSYSAGVPV